LAIHRLKKKDAVRVTPSSRRVTASDAARALPSSSLLVDASAVVVVVASRRSLGAVMGFYLFAYLII
jgi:hypothetical protein